jgi:hypothetical protein
MCPITSKTLVLSTNINQNGYGSTFEFVLPSMEPAFDEVVVKNIALQDTASTGLFFIWSSLVNDNIGCLPLEVAPKQINPDLRISLRGVTPISVSFGVRTLDSTNKYIQSTAAALLSVTLEFRKYVRQ